MTGQVEAGRQPPWLVTLWGLVLVRTDWGKNLNLILTVVG